MKRFAFPTLLAVGLALLGCGGATTSDSGVAELRVIHASPDAGTVSVSYHENVFATGLEFLDAYPSSDTAALSVESGSGDIAFAADSTTLATASFNLADGRLGTAVLAGSASGSDGLKILAASDPKSSLSTAQGHLRFYHASTATSTVDVYITGTSESLSGLTPTINNLSRYAVSDLISLDPGSYRIRVTPSDSQDVLLDRTQVVSAADYTTIVMRPNTAQTSSALSFYYSTLN